VRKRARFFEGIVTHYLVPLMKNLHVVAPGGLRKARRIKDFGCKAASRSRVRFWEGQGAAHCAWIRWRHWIRCSIGTKRGSPMKGSRQAGPGIMERPNWEAVGEEMNCEGELLEGVGHILPNSKYLDLRRKRQTQRHPS